MKNYDRLNALPPDGIERKRAHIIGGGIAGFATAAFLIDDAHMPGENITIYEAAELPVGCLDCDPRAKRRDNRNRDPRIWSLKSHDAVSAALRWR
jgi:myosin-crossreactive antigen